jgi:hypothetical protein
MMKNYFGFELYYNDGDIVLDTTKHGIQRGYVSDIYRGPYLVSVYYYVPVDCTVIEDSDTTLHVNFLPVSDEYKRLLKKYRIKAKKLGHDVSDLKFFDSVGTQYPLSTKHENIDCYYNTDDELQRGYNNNESDSDDTDNNDSDSDDNNDNNDNNTKIIMIQKEYNIDDSDDSSDDIDDSSDDTNLFR